MLRPFMLVAQPPLVALASKLKHGGLSYSMRLAMQPEVLAHHILKIPARLAMQPLVPAHHNLKMLMRLVT